VKKIRKKKLKIHHRGHGGSQSFLINSPLERGEETSSEIKTPWNSYDSVVKNQKS
jgi:hypothetical protein